MPAATERLGASAPIEAERPQDAEASDNAPSVDESEQAAVAEPASESREEIVSPTEIRPTRGPATGDAPGVAGEGDVSARDRSEPGADAALASARDDATVAGEESVAAGESRGLASIERPSVTSQDPNRIELRVEAERRVEIWAAADGRQRRRRTLGPGEQWVMEGRDHFSLEFDDPGAAVVYLDGVRRDPPPGLAGEWILYPDITTR